MKNVLFLILTTLSLTGCSCQKAITEIHQKLNSKTTKEVVLVQLINDSRCPENVQCVWAGEVSFEVAAYDNGKLVAQQQLTLNPTNQDEIIACFTKYLPETKTAFKNIEVLPYPKEGLSVKSEDYFLKLN